MHMKNYQISLFIIGCILLNYFGKLAAAHFNLPIWLDSVGTVAAARFLGPVCGAVVGVSCNIIYGFHSYLSFVYALTSIAIGVTVGICNKKGMLKDIFGVLTTAILVTLISVAISVPLNWIFFDGYTGNTWGDGVIDCFTEWGVPSVPAVIAGQFYLDFMDKVITLLLLYLCVRIGTYLKDGKKAKKKSTEFLLSQWVFLLLPFLLLLSGTTVSAKERGYNDYVRTIYDRDNGLPGEEANTITQTKDGVLWIGTYGGLYRFNGSDFTLMRDFESVKSVYCLYTDMEGRMWIGTNDSGLSIYVNGEIVNVVDVTDGLTSNYVRCVGESSDGIYYVGTAESLSLLTMSGGLQIAATLSDINYANSIATDREGNACVVTNDGSLFLLQGAKICDKLEQSRKGGAYSCICFDDKGMLYAGTEDDHIEIFDVSAGTLKYVANLTCKELYNLKSFYPAEDGIIFVCADNGMGYLDEEKTFYPIHVTGFDSSVDGMLVDYQKNLWFTSSRLGVLRLSESAFREIYVGSGFDEKVVNTTLKWNGNYYFGTDTGLDEADENLTRIVADDLTEELDGVRIRCLYADSRNHMWIATAGKGVWEVEKNGKITVYDSSMGALGSKFRSVLELSDGTVAVASDNGITYIENGKIKGTLAYEDGLSNSRVLCMTETSDGEILAGTDGGGISIIKDGQVVNVLRREDGLSSDIIMRIVANSDENGWFIVTSNGLNYMEDGKVRLLETFPYFNNFDVVESDGRMLFVLSSAGIYAVEKENLLSGDTLNYELLDSKTGLRDAITANAWNYIDPDTNTVFISCNKGVTCMDLNDYNHTKKSYRMIFQTVRADDRLIHVERGEPVVIPRGASRIVLEPEVLNFTVNDPYVSVWLEGFEEKPSIMLQSELKYVVYTNLPSGEYLFHLAVWDNMQRQIMEESTYEIIKEKEIYDNQWFRFYLIVVPVLLIAYLTWLITRTTLQSAIRRQQERAEFYEKQVQMTNETILTIAQTVDAKDENTSQHSFRVSEYSVMLAKRLGFDDEALENLREMALLHDIGKISIPDSILKKPGRLTDEEYATMKTHVTKGAEILQHFTIVDNITDGALYHHERWDGRGYSMGLKGEEIPLNARIIGIADAFDAMTANRVYRQKLDFDFVLEELRKGRGTQFDPNLIDVFLELIEDGTLNVEDYHQKKEEQA